MPTVMRPDALIDGHDRAGRDNHHHGCGGSRLQTEQTTQPAAGLGAENGMHRRSGNAVTSGDGNQHAKSDPLPTHRTRELAAP
jgi:hypothetical protein